jgi:hypothetical protein
MDEVQPKVGLEISEIGMNEHILKTCLEQVIG